MRNRGRILIFRNQWVFSSRLLVKLREKLCVKVLSSSETNPTSTLCYNITSLLTVDGLVYVLLGSSVGRKSTIET